MISFFSSGILSAHLLKIFILTLNNLRRGRRVINNAISSQVMTDEPGVANRAEDWFFVCLYAGDGIEQLVSRAITVPALGMYSFWEPASFAHL